MDHLEYFKVFVSNQSNNGFLLDIYNMNTCSLEMVIVKHEHNVILISYRHPLIMSYFIYQTKMRASPGGHCLIFPHTS